VKAVNCGGLGTTVKGRLTVWPPTKSPRVVAPAAAPLATVTFATTESGPVLEIVPLTPGFGEYTAVAAARFEPRKVIVYVPGAALVWLRLVRSGVGDRMVKVSEIVAPLPNTSVSVVAPSGADVGMLRLAVTWVAEACVSVPVSPGMVEVIPVAPLRFVPVNTTVALPGGAEVGPKLVATGGGESTVKGRDTVAPPTTRPTL
jgi:hypothetical protein